VGAAASSTRGERGGRTAQGVSAADSARAAGAGRALRASRPQRDRWDTTHLFTHPFALALLASASAACLPVHYALQAGAGEFTLLTSARPVEEFLERSDTPGRVRALLEAVPRVKQFGEAAGLRATSNYRRYEELARPAAVWVVSACPELSLQPRLVEFPIAGAVPYLGWFELRAARDYAASLRAEGLDVDLRGASAFSTLGWFDDPLLSTMLERGPAALGALANTVLHESVHATLYLPGQTPFNEGLAEFVAERLTPRYLAAHASPYTQRAWRDEQARRARVEEKLHDAAARLEALYRSALPDARKRERKAEILRALSDELGLDRLLNNALLAQHQAYAAGRAGFAHLLAACGDELRCFFKALRPLDAARFARPNQDDLDPLLDALAARIRETGD